MTQEFTPQGGEFLVNTYTLNGQEFPSIAALSGGGFVVTWASNGQDEAYDYGTYGQRYDANGAAVGDEFRINTQTASSQTDPSIAALSDGGFVVTWESWGQDGSYNGIFGQRYDANGVPAGDEFQINTFTTQSQENPSIAGLSDGGFVVTWDSLYQDGSGTEVYGQRYDASGATVGDEFMINTYTDGFQQYSSTTALSDGGFVVAWESSSQDSDTSGIYAQRYDANGVIAGSEFQINTYTEDDQRFPTITALANGGFVAAWGSSNQVGNLHTYGYYGQRYDANGDAVGAEFQINIQTESTEGFPSITGLSDGGFLVTWTAIDGFSYGVYGQRYDADGGAVGNEFQINTQAISRFHNSVITELSDGDIVVAWDSFGHDGSNNGVYAQIYDLGPNIITGTSAADRLVGGTGNDRIYGHDGTDILIGGDGDDTLIGGSSINDLRDMIYGGDGNDTIDGGYGNDELRGDAGDDTIDGGFGADRVIGGTGDDTLGGGALGDELFGGDGFDFINGGWGHDRVNGGADGDRFYHLGISDHGADWIQDYTSADGDVLLWGGGAATAADFLVQRAETASAGAAGVQEVFVTHIPSGNLLWALVDGDAQAEINIQIGGQVFDLLG